jgi:hypothetical protein
MSSISSAALEDSALGLNEQVCEPLPFVKLTPIAGPFSRSTGPGFPSTVISERSPESTQTSFAAGSPARTSARLEMVQASLELDLDSGANTTGSSKKRGRRGRSSKTSVPFALADWTEFSGNSLRSGMTRSGIAYPLRPLALPTGETESGLLPTPSASSYGNNKGGAAGRTGPTRHSLQSMALHGLWPTPTRRDWKDGSAQSCKNVPVNALLGRAVHQGSQELGSLNPEFVEWLMGFPIGHTDCGPLEIRSSPKSRKSSAER